MFDAKQEIENITSWIRTWFAENGPEANAVLGISGGKDSTIIAALLAKALGPDRVYGVLMPNGGQPDIADSYKVVELLHIPHITVNIHEAYTGLIKQLPAPVSEDTTINIPPRLRMTTLYAIAQSLPNGGRVVNTCNKSEDYIGYSSTFGDAAGDMSPCAEYTVTEMLQIGDALGLPKELIHKTPSDGLCGQTDEDKLGFTYAELDEYIATGAISDKDKQAKMAKLHKINMHKLKPMPKYERS